MIVDCIPSLPGKAQEAPVVIATHTIVCIRLRITPGFHTNDADMYAVSLGVVVYMFLYLRYMAYFAFTEDTDVIRKTTRSKAQRQVINTV